MIFRRYNIISGFLAQDSIYVNETLVNVTRNYTTSRRAYKIAKIYLERQLLRQKFNKWIQKLIRSNLKWKIISSQQKCESYHAKYGISDMNTWLKHPAKQSSWFSFSFSFRLRLACFHWFITVASFCPSLFKRNISKLHRETFNCNITTSTNSINEYFSQIQNRLTKIAARTKHMAKIE